MKEKYKLHDDCYYYDVVRKNIKKYRAIAGITQQELADRIDLTMHYISQIESGTKDKYFTLIVIGRVADALNIDIRQLFDDIENKKES